MITSTLPSPEADQLQASEQLRVEIVSEIEDNNGEIDFSRYMHHALYHPHYGYYSSGQVLFGEGGDFVTAPELGNLFARCLAVQAAQILEDIAGSTIVEFGAGSGSLAADLLIALNELGSLPKNYWILEPSAMLVARQQQTIRDKAPEFVERVGWLQTLPDQPINGVMIANEVLDAIPVCRFTRTDQGAMRIGVGHNNLVFFDQTTKDLLTHDEIPGWSQLADGYCSELHPQSMAWVRSVVECLDAGTLLCIDYGYPAHEYYHPQRGQGTLRCHRQHHVHNDPYQYPGLEDITAHVNFTSLADAAIDAGMELSGFTTQAGFLTALGLLDMVTKQAQSMDTRQQVLLNQQVKRLTLPSDMGELFKVMALSRGLNTPLQGFALLDHRHRL